MTRWQYATLAVLIPVVVVAALLLLLPRATGLVLAFVLLAMAISGVLLVGFFGYRLLADGGDALLWVPPIVLGLGLIAVVLGLGRRSSPQGDA